jgi:DNA-binding transcriptional MerR regulator
VNKNKSILELASEFDKQFIKEKAFSLTDTGVSHRLITYWDEKDLLTKQNDEAKWRKFNFEELIWIRLIAKLRQLNVGVETIKDVKDLLFQDLTVSDALNYPNFNAKIDEIIEGEPDKEQLKQGIKNIDPEKIKGLKINFFQALLKRIYIEKINFSIIIALAESNINELSKSSSSINMTVYSPELIEELAKTKDYFEIFSRTFISISLTELIKDSIININPVKLPPNLTFLSEDEKKILQAIRSGEYKTVTIRFNDKTLPTIMEVSEIKKIKMESRLYEILNKGSYQDVEIKTQNGEIYYCKNTRKIKLSK